MVSSNWMVLWVHDKQQLRANFSKLYSFMYNNKTAAYSPYMHVFDLYRIEGDQNMLHRHNI